MSKSTGPNWKSSEWSKLEQCEQQGKWSTTGLFSSVQFSSAAQSCLTLCDPMDCSTPGLPVHHQLPELTQTHVHWVGDAIQPLDCNYNYIYLCICIYVCAKSLSRVRLFVSLWTIALEAPLFMGFSRQEYWDGLLCPPPGEFSQPRIELRLLCFLHWQVDGLFTTSTTWEASYMCVHVYMYIHVCIYMCERVCVYISMTPWWYK